MILLILIMQLNFTFDGVEMGDINSATLDTRDITLHLCVHELVCYDDIFTGDFEDEN